MDDSRLAVRYQAVRAGPASGPTDPLHLGELPAANRQRRFEIKYCRDSWENFYLTIIYVVNALIALIVAVIVVGMIASGSTGTLLLVAFSIGTLFLMSWIAWKLFMSYLIGNSIEVSSTQYPQIHRVVKQASDYLNILMPTVLILQGHGLFELFVARKFSRRGFIIITSNMLDEFAGQPSSREFMMFIGRQLGHIAAGHFRLRFFKDVIGRFSFFFYLAWKRRCNFTADNIGLLAAGDLFAAEQALIMITAGARIAPGTNFDAVVEQRNRLFESIFSWIRLMFSSYPYMIDRIVRLRGFVRQLERKSGTVGAFPIEHTQLRTLPILLVHGHDHTGLTELREMLVSQFPFIAPRIMLTEVVGALSLPEKFERVSLDVVGAIALVTPDDIGAPAAGTAAMAARARQNVVMEIGWVWGRLGRHRCLLLLRGDVELPSDLSGVDVQRFSTSPRECAESLSVFINHLEAGRRQAA